MPGNWYHLRHIFDDLSDEAMKEELCSSPSLRTWTRDRLMGNDATDSKKYHSALVYYLNTYRPRLQEELDNRAEALAEHWPENWKELDQAFIAPTPWHNALKRRFRMALRHLMVKNKKTGKGTPKSPWVGADAKEWVDKMWPVIRPILLEEAKAAPDGIFPVDAPERIAFENLHLPTQIWYKFWTDPKLPKRNRAVGIGMIRIDPKTNEPVMGLTVVQQDPRLGVPQEALANKAKPNVDIVWMDPNTRKPVPNEVTVVQHPKKSLILPTKTKIKVGVVWTDPKTHKAFLGHVTPQLHAKTKKVIGQHEVTVGITWIDPETEYPIEGRVIIERDPKTGWVLAPESDLEKAIEKLKAVGLDPEEEARWIQLLHKANQERLPLKALDMTKPKLFPVQEEIRRELRARGRKLRNELKARAAGRKRHKAAS